MVGVTTRNLRRATLALAVVGLVACAWEPQETTPAASVTQGVADNVGVRVAKTARAMLGVPYRWGGATPEGFDCSGLVSYAYAKEGVVVPRTTAALYGAVTPVEIGAMRPGDLVFFRSSALGGHVGIVIAPGRFVHAPATGKFVSEASLAQPYYQKNLILAGRLHR